jgi:hypothetical protein
MTGPATDRGVDDDAIRAMLEDRADRASRAGQAAAALDLRSIVAAAGPRTRNRGLLGRLVPRLSLAVGTLTAVIVAGVLVVGPIVTRPVGTAAPTGQAPGSTTPTSQVAPSPSTAPELRVLTPAEAGDLIRTRSAELAGTFVAVDGQLQTAPGVRCPISGSCGPTVLANAGGMIEVRRLDDVGPGPWDGSGPLTGRLILRVGEAQDNGVPVVDYLGKLNSPANGDLGWSVDEIRAGAANVRGAFVAVRGWLVRTPLHPCASIPHPSGSVDSGRTFGCPDDDYLTASSYQPMQSDGSSIGAPNAIELPAGSYDAWAPAPASFGRDSVGVEPREATYLLQKQPDTCPLDARCAAGTTTDPAAALHWRIVGRLDPLVEGATANPSPQPSSADVGGTPWTVAELATAQAPDNFALAEGRVLAVRGWLVATPPLRCLNDPGTGVAPSWQCDEVDWLTDEAFQPWVSNGSGATVRPPDVGLHVQNGAYEAFARPNVGFGMSSGLVPALGTYLIRGSVHDVCETLPRAVDPSAAPCAGPAIVLWEVVGREPDVVHFHQVLPSRAPGETPLPGTDGSGDTPCLPAGQPCG